jgi:phosphohistidine swiveling domain-containing protein
MTEWLLSGHNTQETTSLARPVTVTMTETGLDAQISWFLGALAGDTSDFDTTVKPTQVVQGWLYLNIHYYARNMARVLPFDPTSVGAPAGLIQETVRVPRGRMLALPWRFGRTYRWAARFYRHQLPHIDSRLREIFWSLRESTDNLIPLSEALFDPDFYTRCREADRAHIVISLTITALDGVLRQRAPELLPLFASEATATSLMGQRIWELRDLAAQSAPQIRRMLEEGITDIEAYQAFPEATPLVEGVRAFLRQYGHRGFRFEADFETERLADRPEHILLAVAAQLREDQSPQARAEAARQRALEALRRMSLPERALWQRVLRWGRQLIAWREDSKSNIALRQATYGLAARRLARHFYPDQPEDILMFYTLDEFLAFVRSGGEQRLPMEILNRRRAEYELHRNQPPPPELIWYNPETGYWRPVGEVGTADLAGPVLRFQGIAASPGEGPAEGIALVTNDPLEAGRRLLKMEGAVILVTRLTDPAWSGLFRRLNGVVTELGGVISHAAIVARENGLPAVVGVADITRHIRDGQRLRIDGRTGMVEVIG